MVRQFTLINANGDVWNLMSKSSFFHAPGGLGFTKSIETEIAGFEFIELRDDLDQKVVSGEMVFADYSVYRDFAKFISHEPLKLGYKPYSTTWYYLDVKVSSLQKTEIDRSTGLLLCPVDFLAFTTWYTIDRYENVIPVPPPVVNLMVQGLSAIIEEDWKIVANSDDDFVYRALVGTVAPDYNTVPVQLPGFTGDVYDLTPGDYYFKAIGKRQNVKSYFQTLPNIETASGNPIEIDDAVEVAPNELSVSIEPKQDGTPWINSTQDTDPYTFRAMPSGASGGNREYDKIVGGSFVWNQLIQDTDITVPQGTHAYDSQAYHISLTENHIVLVMSDDPNLSVRLRNTYISYVSTEGQMIIATIPTTHAEYIVQVNGTITKDAHINLCDITVLLGNQTYASAWTTALHKKYFPKAYYAYTATPKIESVSVSEKVTTWKNLFDKDNANSISAYIGAGGVITSNANNNCIYIPCMPNTTYTVQKVRGGDGVSELSGGYTDTTPTNGMTLGGYVYETIPTSGKGSFTITTSGTAQYLVVFTGRTGYISANYATLQIELGSTATTYEAYTANTYALSHTELRGIPSIVDGQLVYDGDEYSSSGSVARKYGVVTYNGTETWGMSPATSGVSWFYVSANDLVRATDYRAALLPVGVDVCEKMGSAYASQVTDISITGYSSIPEALTNYIYFGVNNTKNPSITTTADFQTWLSNHNISVVYQLNATTTESTTPFDNPQVIDPKGTESYTDYPMSQGTRDVAIPVGHKSNYALSVPVVGTDETNVYITGKNLGEVTRAGIVAGDYNELSGYRSSGFSNTAIVSCYLKAGKYTISFLVKNGLTDPTHTLGHVRMWWKNKNGDILPTSSGGQSGFTDDDGGTAIPADFKRIHKTITFTEDIFAIYLGYYSSGKYLIYDKDSVMLNLGETIEDYVPYDSNSATYTHSMSTMYGGTVDMVSGVETSEWATKKVGALTWARTDSGYGFYRFYADIAGKKGGSFNLASTAFPVSSSSAGADQQDGEIKGANGNTVYIRYDNCTSVPDFLAMFSDIDIYYELATPTTSQGAGSAVELLKGDNVLSTDGDDLAVNFKAYPDDRLVLDKFGELESDPDSAVDSQAVSNFTVYDPARVQFYMDYEAIPYDYDVKAELVSGSYSNEKIYSYPYPYTYGAGVNGEIHVTNDGTVPAYCKLTIVGEVEDPTWSVYQNGNLIERGRVTATIVSGHKLVMNSQPRALELSEYSIDGTYIANLYGVSDFSTKRFITIPVGESTITVTHTGETPFDMYLEVYPLAKTI